MTVVVVGGGIVGLSSAYHLAARGAEVIVCEKGSIGGGSTARSAGGIRAQFSTPVNVDLSLASVPVWERFERDFGVDIAYRRTGYLFLARTEGTAAALREGAAMQRARGVPSEVLAPDEATRHCPELRDGAYVAATYSPTDGFADPYLALQGFAGAARDAGAEIRTKTPVTAIHREGDRVVGVEAGGDRIDATHVVNAAGPWAARVAELAGIDIPVSPRRRRALVVDPERPVPEDAPLTIDLDTGAYFRPEREGAAIVGGHFDDDDDPPQDPDGYRESIDLDWAAAAVERAADCAGYFGPDSRIRRGWAGLYAVTPDHHPIVEETVPGFVNAVGFSGHGFQHAPATGRLVAELALDGEASTVDLEPLRSDRFDTGDGAVERNVA
ncbi:NAD(P)/FAD-dependent oxidoreductase [Halegenticoccus tardaugens]|uniref:NAD(P)/FAD-dependent oxidoreductase n=1 Tax=Halegenticoccus tardaugens TaxID=2071624 RepID=UPI00100A53AF|nr:FAD-dependent oxidoreductase [Halegenticoccus tardaugens]